MDDKRRYPGEVQDYKLQCAFSTIDKIFFVDDPIGCQGSGGFKCELFVQSNGLAVAGKFFSVPFSAIFSVSEKGNSIHNFYEGWEGGKLEAVYNIKMFSD